MRTAAYRWHSFISRSETATRAYISFVAAVARIIPSVRLADMIEWAIVGQQVHWKPLAFPPRQVTVGAGTRIVLTPHLGEFDQAALFRSRLDYEKPVFLWLERYVAHSYDAVIEIGANVGVYSVFFDALIQRNPSSRLRRVFAFEPSRRAYDRLAANLAANQARHVEIFALAVSDETGFLPFYEPEGHLTNGSLAIGFASVFSPEVRSSMVATVAGSCLAALFALYERVLLKIDAEGAEPQILAALAPVLERHRPDLLIEVLEGVEAKLRGLDCLAAYSCLCLTADGAVQRAALKADPVDRDWLLTTTLRAA